jgi:lysophospholipase L1-like esterase
LEDFWPAKIEKSISIREALVREVYRRPNFYFVPIADIFTTNGGARVTSGNQVLYFDDDHLTTEGTWLAYSRLLMAIENILNDRKNTFPVISCESEEANKVLHSIALKRSE